VAAAQRVAKRFGKSVIHKTRWKFIEPELQRLARTHRRTAKQELEELVKARLFEAAEAGGQHHPAEIDEAFQSILTRLNSLLAIDILGPNWRQKFERRPGKVMEADEVELDKKLTVPSVFEPGVFGSHFPDLVAQVEARLSLDRLLPGARLSNRDKEVLYARFFQDEAFRDIAAKLKIKTAAARLVNGRALKKIKKSS
jgi:DNA-directed RNA polymerase specialized sigma24 family protein